MIEMSPFLIPIAGIIFGTLMIVGIVVAVLYFKHQEQLQKDRVRLQEMDHIRRMKELELQLELVRSKGGAEAPKSAENPSKSAAGA